MGIEGRWRLCRRVSAADGQADDGALLASSLADLQMMFDTVWMVSRVLGLTVGVKANGKKTAWSGTYWEGSSEKEIKG